jgi:hypothetical protein
MKNNLIITVVLVLIVGAGAFFGGMKYQQSKSDANRQAFNGTGGYGAGNGGQARNRTTGNRQVIGDVISQDDKSITVKLQDGSSKIVLISTNTTVNKASEGSTSDLKVGERVGVFGSDNSDGSVTAQNIQLNPMFRGGPGSGTGTPSAGGGTPR